MTHAGTLAAAAVHHHHVILYASLPALLSPQEIIGCQDVPVLASLSRPKEILRGEEA